MRKIITLIFAALILLSLEAKPQIDMSIYGGISTPNEQMSLVYEDNNSPWDFLGKGIGIGWHLGARIRLPIDTGFFFYLNMGWHRFSDAQIEVIDQEKDSTYQINAKQDIIPIGAGVQYYITRRVVRLYILSQLNYNYFTTHGEFRGLPAPNFDLTDATSRGGFQVGAGVEFNIVLVYPFIEFTYSMPNLIGKSAREPTKQYFNFTLGVNL